MDDADKGRIDLAWKYFELHAKQRTTMFQFFSAMVPLVIAGYFYLIKDAQASVYPGAHSLVAVLGLVLSFAFWLIDRRNEQLVDLSRKQLCTLEKACLYSDGTSAGVFNAADKAKAPFFGWARFRFIMPMIYIAASLAFLLLAIVPFKKPTASASPPPSAQIAPAK